MLVKFILGLFFACLCWLIYNIIKAPDEKDFWDWADDEDEQTGDKP